NQALHFHALAHRAPRQSRCWQAHIDVARRRPETRPRLPGYAGRRRRRRIAGRLVDVRRGRPGGPIVAVLGQRAAEPSPFLFFGFLEHLAPPARAMSIYADVPDRSIGFLIGTLTVALRARVLTTSKRRLNNGWG